MLAGWLFADLFLVLMLAALATQGRADPKPPPNASRSPGPGATRTSCPASYQLEPVQLHLVDLSFSGLRKRDGAAVRNMVGQVERQLKEKNADKRYAGLILAFGISTYDYLEDAEATAKATGDILIDRLPRFRGAKVREFKIEIAKTGTTAIDRGNQLTLDIYFFIRC
jgi:hypothetical protein